MGVKSQAKDGTILTPGSTEWVKSFAADGTPLSAQTGYTRTPGQAPAGGFSPADIAGLQLWLDASDLSTTTFSPDGAYISDGNGLVLPGTGGNYARTPYTASLQFTGDIDVRMKLPEIPYTDFDVLMATYSTGTVAQSKFMLRFTAGGSNKPQLIVVDSTGATSSYTSDVGLPVGYSGWLRVTCDVDDGAGNHVFAFYTSSDGTTWSQLGTQGVTAGAISLNAGTRDVEIGSFNEGSAGVSSVNVARAQIYDGIGGTLVFDADFTKVPFEATSFTEDALGLTVTINSTTSGQAQGAVSQWDDKSGNGEHFTQGTASSQPTTGTRTLNGKNVLDFDGGDRLDNASISLPQPKTLIVVYRADVSSTKQRPVFGRNASSAGAFNVDLNADATYSLYAGAAGITNVGTVTTNPTLLTAVWDGASSNLRIDGASVRTDNVGSDDSVSMYIGARDDLADPLDGAIAEILVYGNALSATDRESIETYLATKWGITL